MTFTRRQWIGSTAAGAAGLAAASYGLSPMTQALAQEAPVDPEAALAALKKFTGTVAHADHYGPCIATVKNGRITEVTPTAAGQAAHPHTDGRHDGAYLRQNPHCRADGAQIVFGSGTKRWQQQTRAAAKTAGWRSAGTPRLASLPKPFWTPLRNTATKAALAAAMAAGRMPASSAPTCCRGASSNLLLGSSADRRRLLSRRGTSDHAVDHW